MSSLRKTRIANTSFKLVDSYVQDLVDVKISDKKILFHILMVRHEKKLKNGV